MVRRIAALDAVRGTAMLFVCLSHFAATYLVPWDNTTTISPLLRWYGLTAIEVSMIASPTFVIVSGIVVGYLWRASPRAMPALRWKLIDRGLFLVLIGHFLQAIARFLGHQPLVQSLQFEFITDVIGIAIIVGPSLLMWTQPRVRVVAGTALLILSWSIAALPALGSPLDGVRIYVFGRVAQTSVVGFPLIPWFGVYLLATALGECLGEGASTLDGQRTSKLLLRLGAMALLVGVGIRAAIHAIRAFAPLMIARHPVMDSLLATDRKYPPGPVYLLLFGGAGIIVASQAFAFAKQSRLPRITRTLAAIGRASFFIFILQDYFYYVLVPAISLPFPALWPLYYAASLVVFAAAAAAWNSFDGNQYLSVGLWRAYPVAQVFRDRIRAAFATR